VLIWFSFWASFPTSEDVRCPGFPSISNNFALFDEFEWLWTKLGKE
jgi:hypothetical protein